MSEALCWGLRGGEHGRVWFDSEVGPGRGLEVEAMGWPERHPSFCLFTGFVLSFHPTLRPCDSVKFSVLTSKVGKQRSGEELEV